MSSIVLPLGRSDDIYFDLLNYGFEYGIHLGKRGVRYVGEKATVVIARISLRYYKCSRRSERK